MKAVRHEIVKLKEFAATAICGNDILSSALYVSGIAILFSGIYAPFVLLFIALVLFLYKLVYTEVVEALPINGGAYNCLLNATSKTVAAIAGVITFLSYIATAVISAKVSLEYVNTLFPIPVILLTVVLLFIFALLVISGIKDSAKVAQAIFVMHILTLGLFVILGLVFAVGGKTYFLENIAKTSEIVTGGKGLLPALFLGFSASLLGISGFESSANFVEEQEKGVFRKTLRNMLLGIALFNPLIAFVILNSLPYDSISAAKDFLLADAALSIGGKPLQLLVVTDAFFVLAGAVLTSYVGVTGLLQRMASDACLPDFFTKMNNKGAYPRIIISFFILASSILLLTKGDLLSLAGVYTISFLGVMSMFAIGNLVLKETRTELKRTYKAPVIIVVFAFLATASGIGGNILINPKNLVFFGLYFIPTMAVVLSVIYLDYILRFLLRVTSGIPAVNSYIRGHFSDLTSGKFVAFLHGTDKLHELLHYINKNETGWNVTLVHCNDGNYKYKDPHYEKLKETVPVIQSAGVFPHFKIETIYKNEPFGPEVIDEVSKELKIHKNRILIGSIHEKHKFDYADLGGVRIIF